MTHTFLFPPDLLSRLGFDCVDGVSSDTTCLFFYWIAGLCASSGRDFLSSPSLKPTWFLVGHLPGKMEATSGQSGLHVGPILLTYSYTRYQI